MKLKEIENYMLIFLLVLVFITLYKLLSNNEFFDTEENDQRDNKLYTDYVLDEKQYVTFKGPHLYEAVCN